MKLRFPLFVAALSAIAAASVGACGSGDSSPPPPACNNNGMVDPGETCDGTDLHGASCQTLTMNVHTGTLACGSDCQYVLTGCTGAGTGGGTGSGGGPGTGTGGGP